MAIEFSDRESLCWPLETRIGLLVSYVYRFRALPLLTVPSLEIQDIDHQFDKTEGSPRRAQREYISPSVAYMFVTYTSLIIVSEALSNWTRA